MAMLALANGRGTIEILTANDYSVRGIIQDGSEPILAIKFSPDGSLLAVMHRAGASLWDVQTLSRTLTLGANEHFNYMYFTHDGSALFTVRRGDGHFHCNLWSTTTGELVTSAQFVAHDSYHWAVGQHPTQDVFLVGTRMATQMSVLRILEDKSVSHVADCPFDCGDEEASVWDICFNSTGSLAVVEAAEQYNLYLIDTQRWEMIRVLKGHEEDILAVSFSPNNPDLLASGDTDEEVILWNAETGDRIKSLYAGGSVFPGMCWNPVLSNHLAICRDYNIIVVDTETEDTVFSKEGVNFICFSSPLSVLL
jgi:WD40 repeat protein